MTPIWICASPREQIAKLTDAMQTPGLAGILVNAPLIEPDFGTFLAQVATCDLPFDVRVPLLPAPPGLATVKVGQNMVLPCWQPYSMAAYLDHLKDLFAAIESNGLTERFSGFVFAPQTAYPYDDEDGLQLNVEDHGTADLAAASFSPAAYVAAHASAASFLNAEPIMAGKLLSWRPMTPGDQPRFDLATGQPSTAGDAFALPNAIMDAISANYTAGPTAFGWTTYDGSQPDTFQQSAASALGGLILQTKTGLTADQVRACVQSAADLVPVRLEIHTAQAAYLA